MIAFTELFYLPLELGTRITISGPVQLRQALPPNAQKKFQTQIKLANHQLKVAFDKWIQRNKLTTHTTRLEHFMAQFFNEHHVFDEDANVDRAITCNDVIAFCLRIVAASKAIDMSSRRS